MTLTGSGMFPHTHTPLDESDLRWVQKSAAVFGQYVTLCLGVPPAPSLPAFQCAPQSVCVINQEFECTFVPAAAYHVLYALALLSDTYTAQQDEEKQYSVDPTLEYTEHTVMPALEKAFGTKWTDVVWAWLSIQVPNIDDYRSSIQTRAAREEPSPIHTSPSLPSPMDHDSDSDSDNELHLPHMRSKLGIQGGAGPLGASPLGYLCKRHRGNPREEEEGFWSAPLLYSSSSSSSSSSSLVSSFSSPFQVVLDTIVRYGFSWCPSAVECLWSWILLIANYERTETFIEWAHKHRSRFLATVMALLHTTRMDTPEVMRTLNHQLMIDLFECGGLVSQEAWKAMFPHLLRLREALETLRTQMAGPNPLLTLPMTAEAQHDLDCKCASDAVAAAAAVRADAAVLSHTRYAKRIRKHPQMLLSRFVCLTDTSSLRDRIVESGDLAAHVQLMRTSLRGSIGSTRVLQFSHDLSFIHGPIRMLLGLCSPLLAHHLIQTTLVWRNHLMAHKAWVPLISLASSIHACPSPAVPGLVWPLLTRFALAPKADKSRLSWETREMAMDMLLHQLALKRHSPCRGTRGWLLPRVADLMRHKTTRDWMFGQAGVTTVWRFLQPVSEVPDLADLPDDLHLTAHLCHHICGSVLRIHNESVRSGSSKRPPILLDEAQILMAWLDPHSPVAEVNMQHVVNGLRGPSTAPTAGGNSFIPDFGQYAARQRQLNPDLPTHVVRWEYGLRLMVEMIYMVEGPTAYRTLHRLMLALCPVAHTASMLTYYTKEPSVQSSYATYTSLLGQHNNVHVVGSATHSPFMDLVLPRTDPTNEVAVRFAGWLSVLEVQEDSSAHFVMPRKGPDMSLVISTPIHRHHLIGPALALEDGLAGRETPSATEEAMRLSAVPVLSSVVHPSQGQRKSPTDPMTNPALFTALGMLDAFSGCNGGNVFFL